jgi:hypothetical protein
MTDLLTVRDLKADFTVHGDQIRAVDGVSFRARQGGTTAHGREHTRDQVAGGLVGARGHRSGFRLPVIRRLPAGRSINDMIWRRSAVRSRQSRVNGPCETRAR